MGFGFCTDPGAVPGVADLADGPRRVAGGAPRALLSLRSARRQQGAGAAQSIAGQLIQGWEWRLAAQKPLELILARNLLTSLSTPAFLVDENAELVFYNEAAGALLGRPFEDVGRMSPEQWTATYGPFGEDGKPLALDELPDHSCHPRRPAGARGFRIRSAAGGENREIASSAFPIVASEEGSSGAMVLFWPTDDKSGGSA